MCMFENEKKFMVIAAHPDDEILGCGATVARFIEDGWQGKTIILSQGGLSRGEEFRFQLEEVKKNAIDANKTIGITNLDFLDFPDNQFDSISLLEIIKQLQPKINNEPSIIFTHHYDDLNIDHRRTFEAVMTIFRPQGGQNPKIFSFFIPSSSDWVDGAHFKHFEPNFFVDVHTTIHKKLDALKYYKTEMKPYPHSRSIDSLKIFSQYWGNRVGLEYVEPFYFVRGIF